MAWSLNQEKGESPSRLAMQAIEVRVYSIPAQRTLCSERNFETLSFSYALSYRAYEYE